MPDHVHMLVAIPPKYSVFDKKRLPWELWRIWESIRQI